MSTEFKHVLVAGPNGNLGPTIISALQQANFAITLLTSNSTKTSSSFPNIPALEADYSSQTSLINTLQSASTPPAQTALVILINRDQLAPQLALLDAAAEVGMAHVIPSCFGYGNDSEYLRNLPPIMAKYQMEDHVKLLGSQGKIASTCIQTSAFLDWALDRALYANLIGAEAPLGGGKGATMVFDSGDAKFSATMLADIGKAVTGVLRDPSQFRNQHINVHSAVISQNQLLGYAKELAPDRDFPVIRVDTAQLEQMARTRYDAGERGTDVMQMFMPRPTFGLGLGLFETVANERLGINVFKEEDLRGLMGRYLER